MARNKNWLLVAVMLSAFSVFLTYCSKQSNVESDEGLYQTLKERMSADPEVSVIGRVLRKHQDNIKSQKYHKKGMSIDEKLIKDNRDDVKSFEDLTALYKKAGYSNSEEMVNSHFAIVFHYQKMYKKYPEIRRLQRETRSKLLKEVLKKPQGATNY